jgi:ribosomal protein S27E
MEFDLLFPDPKKEQAKHKLKRQVQKPNSFFLDIKDPDSNDIIHTFSHANCVIRSKNGKVLAYPSGGKLKFKDGVKIRRKAE